MGDKDKKEAIALGGAKMSQLEANMDEHTAKIVELKEKRKATLDEVNSEHAALTKADALRMKENKAFHAEETDLVEAIAACKQAIVVLSKHNPELAQVRSVARHLQDARVPQLVASSKALRQEQMSIL